MGRLLAQIAEQQTKQVWGDKNAKAMLIVSTAMESEQLQTIMSCDTAKEMWKSLKIIHEQRSAVNRVMLKQQLFKYQMSEKNNNQHISKAESMARGLKDVGEEVSDTDKVAKVLGSLPHKYDPFVAAWDSYDENNLTARPLKEEMRLVDKQSTAFAAIGRVRQERKFYIDRDE